MRRFIAVGTCTLLLITTFASPAAAARPEHGTGGFSYDLTFDPGDLCPSFGVHWVEDGSRMQALTFPVQANGDQLVRYAGPQWSTFTNLATHFSMVVGGGLRLDLVLHQNGTADVWVDGSVVVTYFKTDAPGPSAWLFHGNLHDTLDAGFNTISHSFKGKAVDLCAALARLT